MVQSCRPAIPLQPIQWDIDSSLFTLIGYEKRVIVAQQTKLLGKTLHVRPLALEFLRRTVQLSP